MQIWGDLLRTKKPPEDRPELLCSLNYLPQAERLTVVIMKAKNLDTIQETYVKVGSNKNINFGSLYNIFTIPVIFNTKWQTC